MSPYPAAASPRQITVAFVNCFGAEPPPTAVMPVWAFEPDPENGDLLLNSATLWNCNLIVEALRVEGDDDPRPWPPCATGSGAGPTPRVRARGCRRCGCLPRRRLCAVGRGGARLRAGRGTPCHRGAAGRLAGTPRRFCFLAR